MVKLILSAEKKLNKKEKIVRGKKKVPIAPFLRRSRTLFGRET
jgi:hypothetical protein